MNRTEINRLLGIILYLLPKIFNMGIDYPVISRKIQSKDQLN